MKSRSRVAVRTSRTYDPATCKARSGRRRHEARPVLFSSLLFSFLLLTATSESAAEAAPLPSVSENGGGGVPVLVIPPQGISAPVRRAVGSEVQRIAIQPEVTAGSALFFLPSVVEGASEASFDQPIHQRALAGELRALGPLVEGSAASPAAIDAQIQSLSSKVERWVTAPQVRSSVVVGLRDVGSLYRQRIRRP